MRKMRADQLLVTRGLFESRARAQAAIEAGFVTADGVQVKKSAQALPEDAALIAEPAHPYVSRGGVKLASALVHFGFDPNGKVCLDIGASTGGFTDVLLRGGARRVYAADVGTEQLHISLRGNRNVVRLENMRRQSRILARCPARYSPHKYLTIALPIARRIAMFRAMTTPVFDIATGQGAPASRSPWRTELAETIKLALPIALTQLGQIAMMTTDLALVGRLGDTALAASALAQTVLFAAFVLGMGLVTAVAPLAAQGVGARKPRLVRRALRVGLWASLLLGVPLTLLQLYGETLLLAFGQAPDAAALAHQYLTGLAWSLIPAWWFIAIRNFMGAVNRPEPALWIMLAAIPVNFALAYALIFGEYGIPRLELFGAGIATTIVNIGMCMAAIWVCYARHPFKKYRVLSRFWRTDWPLFWRLLIIGVPISATFLLEYGVFAAAALLMGLIGTTALAAHQIALQTAAIMFMVPFGISMAATVRVGQAVGRGDAPATRIAGFTAIGLGAAFMAAVTLLVVLTRHSIPSLYLGDEAGNAIETVSLAAKLLLVGACFFVFDGIQTIGTGALRGLHDTRVPLVFAVIGFWLIGFTAAYALGFPLGFGAEGIWYGLTIGLFVFASLLVWRFHYLTARGYLPALAGDYSGAVEIPAPRRDPSPLRSAAG